MTPQLHLLVCFADVLFDSEWFMCHVVCVTTKVDKEVVCLTVAITLRIMF